MADAHLRRLQRQAHTGGSAEDLWRYISALENVLGGVSQNSEDKIVTLSPGGSEEREVHIDNLQIPDLWHLLGVMRELPDFGNLADELDEIYPENDSEAGALGQVTAELRNIDGFGGITIANRFNDVWHMAHALKKHIQGL